jgi:hypothetical protein
MWNEVRWTRVCILCFWSCITKHIIVKPTKTESHRTWTFFQFQTGFHITETPALDKIYFMVCNPYIYCQNHVVHVNGVTQLWPPTAPDKDVWVWRATVEWYWRGKLRDPVAVLLCSQQILHGLTRVWTWTAAVRGQQLTTWAMARP